MPKDTQSIIEQEQSLERDIKHYNQMLDELWQRAMALRQMKQNPMVFEISQKHQVPVEKVIAILQDFKKEDESKSLPNTCSIQMPLTNYEQKRPYTKGVNEAIITIMKQHPNEQFTWKKMVLVLPGKFNKGSIASALSDLCIKQRILTRKREPGCKGYEYSLKRKPRKPRTERNGVNLKKLVSFLKDKKQFWHTSESVAKETDLNKVYVSTMISHLARKGLLEREIIGYAKLLHGVTSKMPTYKFHWK